MKKFSANVKSQKMFELEETSAKEALKKAKKMNPKVTHITGPGHKKDK